MNAKFAFTFEFTTEPPETLRGQVTAASMPSLAKEAVKHALKAFPGRKWVSCVLVLDRSGYPGVLSGGNPAEVEDLDAPETSAAEMPENGD